MRSWPTASGLVKEFKKPSTIISLVLALVSVIFSLVFSLYFHRLGNKEGQLAFYPAQVKVFDATSIHTSSPPLTVLDRDHNPITDNIFVATVWIWNTGNAEIKNEDVRIPYRVVVEGTHKIIDWASLFYTQDNEDKFDIRPDLTITWQHFDPGEGLKIRILYAAEHEQKINIIGHAANTLPILNRSTSTPTTVWGITMLAIQVTLIVIVIVMIISVYFVLSTRNQTIREYANTFIRVLTGFLLGGGLVLLAATRPVPPNFLPF